jgi:hypothetical protein
MRTRASTCDVADPPVVEGGSLTCRLPYELRTPRFGSLLLSIAQRAARVLDDEAFIGDDVVAVSA